MKRQGTLYFFCGKMAAGKSTLAKELSREHGTVLISEDSLLGILYPGDISDVPTYIKYSERLKSAIQSMLVDLLSFGVSVFLDFPANTVNQRIWMKGLIEQANAMHELHYIERSDASCKALLAKRSAEQPERSTTDTPEMFDAITKYFEPPTDDEGLNVIVHVRE